jgi:hypothetical protein
MKLITTAAMICLLTSCASINNGSTQSVKILTRNDNSQATRCVAENEEGKWDNLSPNQSFTVHRDGNPLLVECINETQHGKGDEAPEFQTRYLMMDILLIDACIISCIIDGANNAFYDYPGLVIVPMEDKPKNSY